MNQPQHIEYSKAAPPGGTLLSSNYWSAPHFQDELEYVFRRAWLNICRAQELPKPGDFLVQDLYGLGTSVLVVRGNDGVLRAFHNMCMHRGNQVEIGRRGNKSGFRCQFHGWMYDHKGALVGVPQAQKFCTVEPAQCGLRPIHLDVWGGFVHICLADTPSHTLQEFMQPLTDRLGAHFGDQQWYLSFRVGVEVNCNWKLAYDAVIELYHFDSLHAMSVGGGVSAMACAPPELFSEHAGVVGQLTASCAPSEVYLGVTPIQDLTATLGTAGVHTKSKVDSDENKTRYPQAINLHQRPDWLLDLYPTLPHTAYLIPERDIMMHQAWPIAVDHSYLTVEGWTLTPPPRNFSEVFNTSSMKSRLVDVLAEDFGTLERIQRNLVHGAVRRFHYSADEVMVKGLQDLVQVWIDRGKA